MTETKPIDKVLVGIRPCLLQVLGIMELIFNNNRPPSWGKSVPWPGDDAERVSEDVASLEYSPYKAALLDQARQVWKLVIRRKMPAIWFIRTHRPVTVLLSVICDYAEMPITQALNGEFTERDFYNLKMAFGSFAASPLWICDASRPEYFQRGLAALHTSEAITYVFCDWVLEEDELAAVDRLTRELEISFLFPK